MADKTRGQRLWDEIAETHELDPTQRVLLEEACRITDRLDTLHEVIEAEGVVDKAIAEARQQQNVLKQLLVSLRLPEIAGGKRPQARPQRGAYKTGGKVSSIERARANRSS